MPRDENPEEEEERKCSTAYDLIRLRLDRLEKNIHKPAPLPAKQEDLKAPKPPPDFVRNVVGSSAAAGSAEFHIYRNNRRKEQNRLDFIAYVAKKDELDAEFEQRKQDIQEEELAKTAKKRAKRQRQKEKAKKARKNKKAKKEKSEDSDDDEEDDDDASQSGDEAVSDKNKDKEADKTEESTEKEKSTAVEK